MPAGCRFVVLCCALAACTSLNSGDGENAKDAGVQAGGKDASTPREPRDSGREEQVDGARDGSARDAQTGKDGGPPGVSEPTPCELDAKACPMCTSDDDCSGAQPCRVMRCNLDAGRCESTPRRDGVSCKLSADETGVCASGQCAQCVVDSDCTPTQLTCRRAVCTAAHACSTEPRDKGTPCSGGFCNEQAECVECALDENCDANEQCAAQRCECKPGHVPNTGATAGCNFDECALDDDHRCGSAQSGNRCVNTDDGYGCSCETGWQTGNTDRGPQCYRGGSGTVATVPNGATWNLSGGVDVVCPNIVADPPLPECPSNGQGGVAQGQVWWLNICGLEPAPCNAIAADGPGLLAAKLQRVNYSGTLESYGEPSGLFTQRVESLVPGDVILVQTLSTLGLMRIMAVSTELTFEWASIWRDRCFVPGGPSCSAACDCPGGT